MILSPRFLLILFLYAVFSAIFLKILSLNKKKLKIKKKHWHTLIIVFVAGFVFLFAVRIYNGFPQTNQQCIGTHQTSLKPVENPFTPADYFNQGNYDFETGNCQQAIFDYTYAIKLDPGYAEAYNNRAYTYMMVTDYAKALPDLAQAIKIRPDYINALMNQGDIYNYYYEINRIKAIADYDKVIALGQVKNDRTVCGHRFLAEHGGWTLKALIDFPFFLMNPNCSN